MCGAFLCEVIDKVKRVCTHLLTRMAYKEYEACYVILRLSISRNKERKLLIILLLIFWAYMLYVKYSTE